MALSSYNHLLKQVESLKTENSHLRRELQDNSSHLTKLENEASNMKDVLSHLQLTMDDRDQDGAHLSMNEGDHQQGGGEHDAMGEQQAAAAVVADSDGCAGGGDDVAVDLTMGGDAPFGQTGVTDTANNSLNEANDHSHDEDDEAARGSRDANASGSPGNAAAMSGADNRAVYALMQDLDKERSVLMKEIESEEQHRVWFYRQLEIITSKLETLPLSETYSLQTDMARRQLEYEAQQVQGAMTEKLGSTEQSSQRQEARLRRIRTIESEMRGLQRQQQMAHRVSAVSRRDAGTCTTLSRTMFTALPGQETNGYICDRSVVKAKDGHYMVTVAVQTAEVTLTPDEGYGSAAPEPLTADVSPAMYHGAWPIHKDISLHNTSGAVGDLGSVMSFTSTNTHSSVNSQSSLSNPSSGKPQPQQLGTKVEMVYSLLSMLGTHDKDDMSRTLLAMSSSQDSCIAMRQSGCLPLLIQLLHGSDKDSGLLGNTRGSAAARARASAALHNIVHSNPDDKRGRREARTLRLLEQIRAHCDQQRGETATEEDEEEGAGGKSSDIDHHPGPAIAALMKLSFDEDYRHAICTLGGLQAMAELLEVDHSQQGNTGDNYSVTVRRYACMALTNLTFGDGKNKALLCSMRPAMTALVAQLRSPNEDLCQGAASVLRNLSWRADLASKKTLREVGAVTTLMESAMAVKKETTLKSILSALWNLSSHCSENKAEICGVKGSLEFLVSLLTFKTHQSSAGAGSGSGGGGKTHAIVENGGGILRNVSSQVAVREDYRRILRSKGCLQLLLSQLRSTSLTVVSNACGTLWNLSARCAEDQELLREMGAVGMLRNLVHSKHRMIAMGSSAALRNLLSSSSGSGGKGGDCDRGGASGTGRPTLSARKQRALEEELEAQNLSETCDNVESPRDSPTDTPPHRSSDGDGRRFVYPFDASALTAANTSVSHKTTDDDPRRALHRRQVQTRGGSMDSATGKDGGGGGGGGRMRSPQRVPRASSQDSVSSTHSDISHDRSRVHHMLAKSSHLLHRRQGGSLERRKEPQGLHRVSSDHACSSALERQAGKGDGSRTAGPPSRIVRYMQEVAMLAGVGGGSDSNPNSNPGPSEPHQQQQDRAACSSQSGRGGYAAPSAQNLRTQLPPANPSQQRLYEHLVKNVSVNLGYDRGDDSDGSEQPVNYSLKFQDTPSTMYPEPSILGLAHIQPTSLSGNHGNGMHHPHHHQHPAMRPLPPAPLAHSGPAPRLPNTQVGPFHGRHPGNIRFNNYVQQPPAPPPPQQGMGVGAAVATPHPRAMVPPNVAHGQLQAPAHSFPPPPPHQQQQQQLPHPSPLHHPQQQVRHGFPGNHKGAPPPPSSQQGGQFCAYAETDLDSMDEQPTDFSLRYAEDHSDDQDQPVNYSLRYRSDPDPDCVECKYEEARRTNERLEQSANDDQVLTFCTEGTPFLSTATSLTDLTGGKQNGEDGGEEGKVDKHKNCHRHGSNAEEDEADELHNYSAQYGESEDTPAHSSCGHHTGSTAVVRPTPGVCGAAGRSYDSSVAAAQSSHPQQTFHSTDDDSLPPDQMKTYCEEGTPVCFSRVSSLSSLHSSEARDVIDPGQPVMLQSIEESDKGEMSTSVIENKNAVGVKTALVDREHRRNRTSGQGQNDSSTGEKESKTVTFDESRHHQQQQQVEETPLMFSRCSSLGSLSSFDTQSVHSSVVSEYSRRASQVVSPSELPDSPSETMPPSPTRLQSPPVRAFKPVVAPSANSGGAVGGGGGGGGGGAAGGGGVAGGGGGAVLQSSVPPPPPTMMKTGQVGNKVNWQRGAEEVHVQADDKTAKLLDIFRSSIPKSALTNDAASTSGKSEVPVVYADEGTPPVFSETSSLSALTVDDEGFAPGSAPANANPAPAQTMVEFNASKVEETDSADVTLCEATQDNTLVKDDRDSSMSEVSEGEEDILAQCISAAMPAPTNNANRKLRGKAGLDSAVRKKSALPKPETASPTTARVSRLPTKVAPTPQSASTPQPKSSKAPSMTSGSGKASKPAARSDALNKKGSSLPSPNTRQGQTSAKPPRPAQNRPVPPTASQQQPQQQQQQQHQQLPQPPRRQESLPDCDDYAPDTLRTFAEEGTPLNFSAATSLSDLSCVTDGQGKVKSPAAASNSSAHKSPEDCKSDSSSLCEESEQQLLNDMIQAAMPKSRAARRLDVDQADAGQRRSQPGGTRANPRGAAAKRDDSKKSQQQQPQQQSLPSFTKPIVQLEVPFVSSAVDTTQTYATEGTPNNFSAATSLSDLTIDSVDDSEGVSSKGGRLSSGRSPAKSHQVAAASGYGVATNAEEGPVFSSEGMDSPRVYGMEGTPTTFSRNDSLSSIDMLDDNKSETLSPPRARNSTQQPNHPAPIYPNASERHVIGQSSSESSVKSEKLRSQQQQPHRAGHKDETKQFDVEDTPLSFSRNSSLSSLASGGRAKEPQPEEEPQISRTSSMGSLSAESAGFDPTPSEQALLDQCISAAMPKRRPSRADDRSRRHSRTVAKNEGRTLQEGGSLKNSALDLEEGRSLGGEAASVSMAMQGGKTERQDKLMTRSCSDALDMESDDGGRHSRFSSWRKQRDESMSMIMTQQLEKRSHSQENLLKTQKDICNRITQSGESSSSSNSSSNSASRYTQSCTTSVIHVDPPSSTIANDNRLMDHHDDHQPVSSHPVTVTNIHHHSLVASFTDSSSSGEKADSEKSVCDDHTQDHDLDQAMGVPSPPPQQAGEGCDDDDYTLENNEDEVDYDPNETIMEANIHRQNLRNNRTLDDFDNDDDDDLSSQHNLSVDQTTIHIVPPYEEGLEERLCFGSGNTSFDHDDGPHGEETGHASSSFEQEMTPEDELLLQQNASLIVSEIVTKRDMTGSALDEDLFIENETISLVSNDYTSDTASEVSVSWSTTSEKMSDRSCSQASQADTSGSGSAKVIKPGSKLPKKMPNEDDVKAVRGRRKPLYTKPSALKSPGTNNSTTSSSNIKPRPGSGGGANSRPTSGGSGSGSRPTSGVGGNARTPAPGAGRGRGAGEKKTSPRTPGGGQQKSNLPGPTKASPGQQKTSTATASTPPAASTPNKPAGPKTPLAKTQTQAGGSRPGSGSGIPRSPAKAGNTPPSRLPSATNRNQSNSSAAERPKPPVKQATFVKETPTASDSNSRPSPPAANSVRLRARSASRGRLQADKRKSGGSFEGSSQRNSIGSPPEAWSKALDSFNFVVDKGGQSQRSGPALKRNITALPAAGGKQQPRPSNIARPQGSVGSPPKAGTAKAAGAGPKPAAGGPRSNLPSRTGAASNLNKSGSASSLRKMGSGSSLTKTSSGSSLNKGPGGAAGKKPSTPPNKVDIKKSESNASLRRSSDGSRPTTPIGRKTSNPTSQVKAGMERGASLDETKQRATAVTPPGGGGDRNSGGSIVASSNGKKQVPSKIASLWKKEEGVHRSASVEEPSSMLSQSSTFTKPRIKSSSLPASARHMTFNSSGTFVKKSSSVNSSQSSEEQSGSSTEVIPRSSTYDKIPSRGHAGAAWPSWEDEEEVTGSSGEGMLELCDPSADELENAPESMGSDVNLDEAYIQEDPDSHAGDGNDDAHMACSIDSLDEQTPGENTHLAVTTGAIDSSTWRRNKHRPPPKEGDVTLQLPNADETCRSMCSFLTANDSQNESMARGGGLGGIGDISVWQKCGDDSAISEISFLNNTDASTTNTGKKAKNKKSVAKSIKSTFAGIFGSKQSKDSAKGEKGKKPITEYTEPKIVTNSMGTSTKTISVPTSKPSPGAIVAPVAPFNYSPPSTANPMSSSVPVANTTQVVVNNSSISTSTPGPNTGSDTNSDSADRKGPGGTKHMTKTEMLLARRRKQEEGSGGDGSDREGGGSQRGCMVTTV